MHRKTPFTFLELVVACAIVAVMTALGGAIIYTFPRGYSELEEHSSRLKYLLKMDAYADNIVRNALPLSWLDSNDVSRQIFCGDKDMMILAGRDPRAMDKGIVFSVMGKRQDTLVVQYRTSPLLYWEEDEEKILPETIDEEIIARGVTDLQIFYGVWEDGTLTWQEDWDEEAESKKENLPPVIAWTVTFDDNSKVHYVRRTCGNSYVTSYGRDNAAKK